MDFIDSNLHLEKQVVNKIVKTFGTLKKLRAIRSLADVAWLGLTLTIVTYYTDFELSVKLMKPYRMVLYDFIMQLREHYNIIAGFMGRYLSLAGLA